MTSVVPSRKWLFAARVTICDLYTMDAILKAMEKKSGLVIKASGRSLIHHMGSSKSSEGPFLPSSPLPLSRWPCSKRDGRAARLRMPFAHWWPARDKGGGG